MAERVHVTKNSVFVDCWDYHKPSLIPDEDGNIKLIFQACFGPCEWWEWSMDAQGKFWMEYKWCENDFYEEDNFKEEISQEKMIEKIQSMQRFFAEHGVQEYVEVYQKVEEFVRRNNKQDTKEKSS